METTGNEAKITVSSTRKPCSRGTQALFASRTSNVREPYKHSSGSAQALWKWKTSIFRSVFVHIYALLRVFYAVRVSVSRETDKEAVSKTAVCLSRRRGNGCLGMQKDFSGNLISLQFAERFHFLLFQKFVDAAKVFADALVAELVHLAYQSVEEVTVVADNN